MWFKKFFYLDPGSEGGGGSEAAPAAGGEGGSSEGGAVHETALPANAAGAKTGAETFASFREGLQKHSTPQPPAEGQEEDAENAELGEGGEKEEKKDEVLTTDKDGKPLVKGENKTAWSEEDKAALKAHKWDKLPFSPEAAALLKTKQELQAEFSRVSGSNSNAIARNTQLEAALHSGDVKTLQEMGFDLQFDKRTTEDMTKELEVQFNEVKQPMEAAIAELRKAGMNEAADYVKQIVQGILNGYNQKASLIESEKAKKDEKANWAKEFGLTPKTAKGYENLSKNAEANLTSLTQKDPDAPKYYAEIKEATKPGGPLHALGVNLARAYGTSPESAAFINDVAKGLFLSRNMPDILKTERARWAKDELAKAGNRKPGGNHPAHVPGQGGKGSESVSRLQEGMRSRMPKPQLT